jgi:hypothetical protein
VLEQNRTVIGVQKGQGRVIEQHTNLGQEQPKPEPPIWTGARAKPDQE